MKNVVHSMFTVIYNESLMLKCNEIHTFIFIKISDFLKNILIKKIEIFMIVTTCTKITFFAL